MTQSSMEEHLGGRKGFVSRTLMQHPSHVCEGDQFTRKKDNDRAFSTCAVRQRVQAIFKAFFQMPSTWILRCVSCRNDDTSIVLSALNAVGNPQWSSILDAELGKYIGFNNTSYWTPGTVQKKGARLAARNTRVWWFLGRYRYFFIGFFAFFSCTVSPSRCNQS